LDKATHDSFSPDKPEPYFAEPFAKLQRALAKARLIVLTHHHADHVAGVLRAPNFSELATKTMITRQVADCMRNTPHRPHLKLAPPALERFIILDYPQYYPVAPGVVLIRSPGHSPDSQMVFIRLQLRWLKAVAETEKNITILVTHDDELFDRLTQNGTIGKELAI
jgi:glyoxylase-like metal-dependent hydrolase (beta-lactamase superfamily II)